MLIEELEKHLHAVSKDYHQFISTPELSHAQYFVLLFIQKTQMCKPSEIAQNFSITLGAVTGLIDRLEKNKFVSRTHSQEDRRQVLITLTPKGEIILEKIEKEKKIKSKLLKKKMCSEDLQELISLLAKLEIVLDEINKKERKKS